MGEYQIFDLPIVAPGISGNKYKDVTLHGVFQGPTKTIEIDGFWDGGNIWRVRMAPTEVGQWQYTITSSRSELNTSGSFECVASDSKGFIHKNGLKDNEIVIKKKIVCKFVKYKNRLYNLDTDRFFVKNIHIKISNNIDKVYVEEHYHVNVSDENNVCLNELKNKDIIYVFENIEKFLEICNLDSAFSNEAKEELKKIVEEKHKGGEVWHV